MIIESDSESGDEVLRAFFRYIPAVADGTVVIKAIARERGVRSLVLVHSEAPATDAVGLCVGERGVRIKALVKALAGENLDLVRWSSSTEELIRGALAPLVVLKVAFDSPRRRAIVTVRAGRGEASRPDLVRLRLASKAIGWELECVSG